MTRALVVAAAVIGVSLVSGCETEAERAQRELRACMSPCLDMARSAYSRGLDETLKQARREGTKESEVKRKAALAEQWDAVDCVEKCQGRPPISTPALRGVR